MRCAVLATAASIGLGVMGFDTATCDAAGPVTVQVGGYRVAVGHGGYGHGHHGLYRGGYHGWRPPSYYGWHPRPHTPHFNYVPRHLDHRYRGAYPGWHDGRSHYRGWDNPGRSYGGNRYYGGPYHGRHHDDDDRDDWDDDDWDDDDDHRFRRRYRHHDDDD